MKARFKVMTVGNKKITILKLDSDYLDLTRLVNDWDPVGLIGSGAPDDEYSCLTGQIISALYKGSTLDELTTIVKQELSDHFGYDLTDIERRSQCNRILDWYHLHSCNMNKQRFISAVVEYNLKEIVHCRNSRSQNMPLVNVVKPFEVKVDSKDDENEPYKMWVVLQEYDQPTRGKVITYDLENNIWGIVRFIKNNYNLLIALDSLAETLEVFEGTTLGTDNIT
jgi:hypothetical protein